MKAFDEHFEEMMQDPEFVREYEALQPEMEVARAICLARAQQGLTQADIAERTGIRQSEISKIENGTRNVSIKLLQRLADGLGMTLHISFVPKTSL